jgi:hypothetical protein
VNGLEFARTQESWRLDGWLIAREFLSQSDVWFRRYSSIAFVENNL